MPSYRKDRPERSSSRPSGFRRDVPPRPRETEEEEEVEERSFRPAPMFRRDMGPSQYASRPIGPAERRSLEDVLVPKSEREDPHFDYSKVFDMFPRFGRGRGPAAGPSPGPVPPPREAPPRGEPPRPGRTPGQPPQIDAAMFFDLGRIWNAAAQLRQDPRFRPGSAVAVVRTAPSQEINRFFRIRPEEVTPFLDELAYSINAEKPRELPGRFLFQQGKDGFVWLAYVE